MSRFRGRLVRSSAWAWALVAALALALVPPSSATAETTGGLFGHVVGPDGEPLAGIEVMARPGFTNPTTVLTDAAGRYEIAGLPPTSYELSFWDPARTFVSERYDNAFGFDRAQRVEVVAGAVAGPYDAALGLPASLSGVVTAEGGPVAQEGVSLYAWDLSRWVSIGNSFTDSAGRYIFDDLQPGIYRVGTNHTDDPFVDTFHPDADTLAHGDTITLAHGQAVTDADIALLREGTIQGRVTDVSGDGLAGVEVTVTDVDRETRYVEATTDATGRYRVGRLTTGGYVVSFNGYAAGKQSEFWDHAPSRWNADMVSVTSARDSLGIDAVLTEPSLLRGIITDRDTGEPIPYASVTLYEKRGAYWQGAEVRAYAGADGRYELPGVWGTYRLLAIDRIAQTHDHAFYPEASSPEAGDSVDIPAGAEVEVDISLAAKASPVYEASASPTITGTVEVGQVLTASSGTWTPSDATYRFEWLTDNGEIPGATTSTLALDDSLAGERIRVRVTATGASASSGTAVSATTAPVAAAPDPTPTPEPTPTATPTATPTPTTTPTTTPTPTTSTQVPTTSPVAVPPAPAPVIANAATPRITGAVEVGQVLRVAPGRWTPSTVRLTYQWLADGHRIRKATRARFRVTRAQLGARLRVRIRAASVGAETVVVRTRPTARIKA
jgi:protocatechuate 3,4-dioxygenase beta subunit